MPKNVQETIQPREERFPGAHAFGWCLMILSGLIMLGAVVYGVWDGIRNEFSFGRILTRFLVMLLGLKVFDILFFDLFLLCHSNFYPYFYPETKELLGPYQFGLNKWSHVIQIIACILVSLLISWICTLR